MKLLLLFVALISTHMAHGADSVFISSKQTVCKRIRTEMVQRTFAVTTQFRFDGQVLYAHGQGDCGGQLVLQETSRKAKGKKTTIVYDNLQGGKVKEVKVIWHSGQISAIYFRYEEYITIGYFL